MEEQKEAERPITPRGDKALTERVKDILVRPKEEWPRIDAEPATIGGIYTSYVMILAAIPPLAGAIGILVFGYPALFGISVRPSAGVVIGGAIAQYVLTLIGVYVLAMIIEALAPSFGGVKDRVKAFKVAAYSGTAGWVAGVFSLIPSLSWLGLIGLYSLYLLYLGLPRVMNAPEDKAVGYAVVTILAAIVLYFIVGAVAGAVLGAMAGPRIVLP